MFSDNDTPIFDVSQVEKTTVVVMNESFRTLLTNLLLEVDTIEPQIYAMARILENPRKAKHKVKKMKKEVSTNN